MPYHRATILVIDDEPVIRDLTVEALRDEGYAAVTLADHAAAQRALAKFRFDGAQRSVLRNPRGGVDDFGRPVDAAATRPPVAQAWDALTGALLAR